MLPASPSEDCSAPDPTAAAHADPMPALTGIRLPFALWVVAHHISGPDRMLEPLASASTAVEALVEAAWVALSVFFAISGFALARRYRTMRWTRETLGRYAAARFGRIYPVYLLSLLILTPIIVEALRGGALGSAADRAGLLVNHVLLLQGWYWPGADWNTPAWSLSCEVFFYALAPVLVLLVRVPSWPRIAAVALLACAVPIALRLLISEPIPKAPLYLGDFLIGIAAAGLYERLRGTRAGLDRLGPWLYAPACILGVALLLGRDAIGSFLLFDTGIRIVSALLILGLACGGGWLVRVLASPAVLAGGQASYAIYILHVPVLWWYRRWTLDTWLPPLLAATLYVGVVVSLSLWVYRWYEVPANARIRRWCAGRRPQQAGGTMGRPGAYQISSAADPA